MNQTTEAIGQDRHTLSGLLMTVEQVAVLLFGEVGPNGSASSNCQKVRRLIPDALPARRIGNRWYVNRAVAEAWAAGADPALVMAHPDTRAALAVSGARTALHDQCSFREA